MTTTFIQSSQVSGTFSKANHPIPQLHTDSSHSWPLSRSVIAVWSAAIPIRPGFAMPTGAILHPPQLHTNGLSYMPSSVFSSTEHSYFTLSLIIIYSMPTTMQYILTPCFVCARCRDAEVPDLCTVLAGMGTSGRWPILAGHFTDRIQLDLADSDLLQPKPV